MNPPGVDRKNLAEQSDADLVRRFADGRDQCAFACLVERHSRLVLGACQRMLKNRQDAQDAFQATFLTLARRINSVRKVETLAGWLYGVAVRVSLNVRRSNRQWSQAVQRAEKNHGDAATQSADPHAAEALAALDEELARLSGRYRDVLVLCDLDGHTQKKAALKLGVSAAAVSSRAIRGRKLLRKALVRRGITVSASGLVWALSQVAQASPQASAELIHGTAKSAVLFLAGKTAAAGGVSLRVTSLVHELTRALMIAKLKLTACVVSLAVAFGVLSPSVSSMLGLTGGVARGQYQFGPATELTIPGNAPNGDFGAALTSDNLTLYFTSNGRSGGLGGQDLWRTTRATPSGSFGAPVNLGAPLNSSSEDLIPKISLDGLTLYLVSNRPGTLGNNDIWISTRATTSASFDAPVNMGAAINTPSLDGGPDITADGLTLVFNSDRPGGSGDRDIYIATRASTASAFGSVVNLGPTINTSDDDYSPSISADGLILFFASTRPGGFGDHDLWVTTRASLAAPWGAPVNLGPDVNGPFTDYNPEISWDGSRLVFTSTRSVGGNGSIYEVAVVPEPSTSALIACGLLLAGTAVCRRNRRAVRYMTSG